jgi:hypothetical protein
VGKKKLGGGADFLSVIVLFLLSNYGPVRHCAITVKQFCDETERYTNGCCVELPMPAILATVRKPNFTLPLGEKPK